MSALRVAIRGAKPAAQTASPAIVFRLHLEDTGEGRVHALPLRCQTIIEPRGRQYTPDEQGRLYELFGSPDQWDRTLRSVTWAQSSIVVPSFERETEVDLTLACTYDLEVASAKYLHAVRDGDVPLRCLFSGSVMRIRDGFLQVDPVPWDLEAAFRMPAAVWRDAMDQFFPGDGWLRLRRATIDRLQAFRGRSAVVSWDDALALLLERAGVEADGSRPITPALAIANQEP